MFYEGWCFSETTLPDFSIVIKNIGLFIATLQFLQVLYRYYKNMYPKSFKYLDVNAVCVFAIS